MNDRQARFVEEYLVDFNATQAAIRAGYSAKTAYSIGPENLKKPEISEAISDRLMSANEVISRLTDIARGDIKNLMSISTVGFEFDLIKTDEEGNRVVNPNTKLIKKIKQKITTIMPRNESGDEREIVEIELELYSAIEALSLLGKHHKLFVDKMELTGKDAGPIELVVSYAEKKPSAD